jgi:hypothetical protein
MVEILLDFLLDLRLDPISTIVSSIYPYIDKANIDSFYFIGLWKNQVDSFLRFGNVDLDSV